MPFFWASSSLRRGLHSDSFESFDCAELRRPSQATHGRVTRYSSPLCRPSCVCAPFCIASDPVTLLTTAARVLHTAGPGSPAPVGESPSLISTPPTQLHRGPPFNIDNSIASLLEGTRFLGRALVLESNPRRSPAHPVDHRSA